MRLLAGLICGACFSSCVAQTITIDLREKSDNVCRPGWAIGTANNAYAPTATAKTAADSLRFATE